jgi:GGDEF domain-containing protein
MSDLPWQVGGAGQSGLRKIVGPDGLEPSTHGLKDLLLRADNAMYKAKREGLGVCRL